jgi:hypothetical protein
MVPSCQPVSSPDLRERDHLGAKQLGLDIEAALSMARGCLRVQGPLACPLWFGTQPTFILIFPTYQKGLEMHHFSVRGIVCEVLALAWLIMGDWCTTTRVVVVNR